MTSAPSTARPRIGVFDSGVGGLSVLRAVREALPLAELLYVADSAHAPYGERTEDFIRARSVAIADFLLAQGAQLIVVACNTATAAAVSALRERHPSLPLVGVEPGLKPAVAVTRNGRVGVMATTGTLRSDKFQRLMASHSGTVSVHLQACPGLAHAIEEGPLDSPALAAVVEQHCAPLRAQAVDTVVLGCTHYPFAAPLIQQALGPDVVLIDTAHAVARQVVALVHKHLPECAATPNPNAPAPGALRLWSSGDPARLSDMAHRWLGVRGNASALPIEV